MTTQSSQFDRIAERFERPARIVREFAALAQDYPQVASDLLSELYGSLPSNGSKPAKTRGETQHQRVTRLFRETGNKPLTKQEMVDQTGIKEGSIHGIIYDKNTVLTRDGKRGRAATYRLLHYVDQPTGDE